MRPSKHARNMMKVELESMWSTCKRLQVGALIVDQNNSILSSGYNGSPSGELHCNESPEREGNCTLCNHAEMNAIAQAAKNGVRIRNAIMYCLYRPCIACAKNIVQSGISMLYYRGDYDSDNAKELVLKLLNNNYNLSVVKQLEPTHEELLFSEMLKNWKSQWGSGLQKMLLH